MKRKKETKTRKHIKKKAVKENKGKRESLEFSQE